MHSILPVNQSINKQDQLSFGASLHKKPLILIYFSSNLLTELFFWSVVRSLLELPRIHDKNVHAAEDALVSNSYVS